MRAPERADWLDAILAVVLYLVSAIIVGGWLGIVWFISARLAGMRV
jgi:hypothetical protein